RPVRTTISRWWSRPEAPPTRRPTRSASPGRSTIPDRFAPGNPCRPRPGISSILVAPAGVDDPASRRPARGASGDDRASVPRTVRREPRPGRLPRPGRVARADGLRRLPEPPRRPARGRRRLPEDLPGPGPEGG